MIQKAYNDSGFSQTLNMKAKQEVADRLIRKQQRTDHPRHKPDKRRDRWDSRGEEGRFDKETRPKDRNGQH